MMTKEELLFVADKVENYRNPNESDWVLESCPINPNDRQRADIVARLPISKLTRYG